MRLPARLFCVSPANLSTMARWALPSMLELPVAMASAHDLAPSRALSSPPPPLTVTIAIGQHLAPRYRWFLCGQPRQPDRHPSKRRDRNQRRLQWSLVITPTSFRQTQADPVVNLDSHDNCATPEQDRGNADDRWIRRLGPNTGSEPPREGALALSGGNVAVCLECETWRDASRAACAQERHVSAVWMVCAGRCVRLVRKSAIDRRGSGAHGDMCGGSSAGCNCG